VRARLRSEPEQPAARVGLAPSRLSPGDVLRVGSLGLRTRRMRALLSALGISIGIATVVAVLGISESSRAGLLSEIDRLGTNLLTVSAGQTLGGGNAQLPVQSDAAVGHLDGVERASAVTGVSDATVRRTQYIPEEDTSGIAVDAADLDLLTTLDGRMASGRFLDSVSALYPAVVLGAIAAQRLGLSGNVRGAQVFIGGRWFTVIGVMAGLPLAPEIDRAALIGYPVAESLLGAEANPSEIYVRAAQDQVTAVRDVIAATANPDAPEEVDVSRPSDALEARAAAEGALTSLFLGLGAVALLVGAVGIANVMVISVLERRSEIGLRRALGATRGHIRSQFLAESLILVGIGGLAGVALGAIVTVFYATSQGWQVTVPPAAIAGGVLASLAIGALAGLYPAGRAARISPTEALRTA
jgi:putative ABC transport system permease protein